LRDRRTSDGTARAFTRACVNQRASVSGCALRKVTVCALAGHVQLAGAREALGDRRLQRAQRIVIAHLGLVLQGQRLGLQPVHGLQLHIEFAVLGVGRAQGRQRRAQEHPPHEREQHDGHSAGKQGALARGQVVPAGLQGFAQAHSRSL